jgi:hypothetical protein
MNPAEIILNALRLIEQAIADARAANDAAAVAALEALVANSSVGRELLASADRAQAAIDAGRAAMVLAAELQGEADKIAAAREDVMNVDVVSLIADPLP